SVALKHLSEERGGRESVAGLVLVATPFWGGSEWEQEWALPEGWPDGGVELPRIWFFHSRDDEVAPFAHLELYARRFPDATACPLNGYGHLFEGGDLTQIVKAIRALSAT